MALLRLHQAFGVSVLVIVKHVNATMICGSSLHRIVLPTKRVKALWY